MNVFLVLAPISTAHILANQTLDSLPSRRAQKRMPLFNTGLLCPNSILGRRPNAPVNHAVAG